MSIDEPRGNDYWYQDETTEEWKIREDAPQWAKDEFKLIFDLIE